MGNRVIREARATTVGDERCKGLLILLADTACDVCGLAWPGVKLLAEQLERRERLVRDELAKLRSDGWIEVFRFPHGGRGLSTEYVVLPWLWGGVTRPCLKCQANMKNPAPVRMVSQSENPANGGRVSAETLRPGGENPAPAGAHQPSVNPQPPSRAYARARGSSESGLSAGQAFDHPSDDPRGRAAAAEAMRTVRAMTGAGTTPDTATATAAQGETDEHRVEAEP